MDLKKLKTERKRRKLKIKDIVRMTGLSRNLISQIENGNGRTAYDNVEAYVRALEDVKIEIIPKQ